MSLSEASRELLDLKRTITQVHRQIEKYNKELITLEHTLSEYQDKMISLELLILDKLSQSRHNNKH